MPNGTALAENRNPKIKPQNKTPSEFEPFYRFWVFYGLIECPVT